MDLTSSYHNFSIWMRTGIVTYAVDNTVVYSGAAVHYDGTPILVGGRRTCTLGLVAMDMLAVDLSSMPEAHVGTPVTLWGEGLSADEVAASSGTVSYELLCAVAARVPIVEV